MGKEVSELTKDKWKSRLENFTFNPDDESNHVWGEESAGCYAFNKLLQEMYNDMNLLDTFELLGIRMVHTPNKDIYQFKVNLLMICYDHLRLKLGRLDFNLDYDLNLIRDLSQTKSITDIFATFRKHDWSINEITNNCIPRLFDSFTIEGQIHLQNIGSDPSEKDNYVSVCILYYLRQLGIIRDFEWCNV